MNVALPTIERDLHIGLQGEQWIFLAYSLALAALYLLGGAVGDRIGRRAAFIAGMVGFALASAVAGAAPNGDVLIAARALQGVAGALLTPGSLALLRSVYADEASRAIGLWSAWTGVSTIFAPFAGGALAEWASWRWIFFLNLPLAGVAIAMAAMGSAEGETRLTGHLDIPGAALAATGFGTLTYGLVVGPDKGFDSAVVVACLVLAVLALAAFVVVELRVAQPLLPLELFRRRNFAAANLETFLVYGALSGNFFFLALYLQSVPGYSPVQAAGLIAADSALLLLLASRLGALADRHGPRLFLTVGPALLGLASLLLLLYDGSQLWTVLAPSVVIFGVGLGFLVGPITATALGSAPGRLAGIAAGVNSTVSRLGGLLAVAALGLVVATVFDARTERENAVPLRKDESVPALREASTDAFHAAMLGAGLLALAGAAVGALGISNREARGSRD